MVTAHDDSKTGTGTGAAVLAFGAFMVFAAFVVFHHQRAAGGQNLNGSMETTDASDIEVGAVMGNQAVRGRTQAFHVADVAAILGHSELDLTEARLAAGRGSIDVFVMFGQADVRVPPDWTVVTKSLVTLGSVKNQTRSAETDPGKSLKIAGVVLFGELRILRGQ